MAIKQQKENKKDFIYNHLGFKRSENQGFPGEKPANFFLK